VPTLASGAVPAWTEPQDAPDGREPVGDDPLADARRIVHELEAELDRIEAELASLEREQAVCEVCATPLDATETAGVSRCERHAVPPPAR